MGVTILQLIEEGGFDLSTPEDANWLLAQRKQFEELVDKAEAIRDAEDDRESAEAEAKYRETFPEDEE